jgi:hypothetical protein
MRLSYLSAMCGLAVAVPHHGAYADPKHYAGPSSWAGLRFIQEGPAHILSLVGTDDGENWWTVQGSCSNPPDGPRMSVIKFDFSPKGGPKDLTGRAVRHDNGTAQIVWPDGNAWTLVPDPSLLPPSTGNWQVAGVPSSANTGFVALGVAIGAGLAMVCAALRERQQKNVYSPTAA